ncbi:hypothetical protein [Pseudomonas sp. GW101-3H06]|uniref:hypothetical protein n=1 Tax=Pseudomonas sp. GW101-3H06 TaxID=2751347 RepID=UPI001A922BE0|nr:hypothetical protein [Pseudomonas sp. GW101-3H06]
MALMNYIETLSQHGTHRIVATLVGDQIPVKRLCKALKMRIQDYVGLHQHRIAWFKTTYGLVLMVSGGRVVAEVVEKFLAGYTGAFQEHQVLYTGVGSKVFVQAVSDALINYVPGNRSYGASR